MIKCVVKDKYEIILLTIYISRKLRSTENIERDIGEKMQLKCYSQLIGAY